MIEQVRPADLPQWLARHRAARPCVLDVREPWELVVAHLAPGDFELAAIPMGLLPARLHELDPDRAIACLCHLGVRSMRVALYLQGKGFSHVANIEGGIHAWSLQCDPSIPTY